MKRDMDLVRDILLAVEENDDGSGKWVNLGLDNREHTAIVEHLHLLAEAGLIDGNDTGHIGGRDYKVRRLTWLGHEYLDNIRDPEVWMQTKEGAKKVGAFSLDVIGAIAKGIIKKKIESLSGVEIDL